MYEQNCHMLPLQVFHIRTSALVNKCPKKHDQPTSDPVLADQGR